MHVVTDQLLGSIHISTAGLTECLTEHHSLCFNYTIVCNVVIATLYSITLINNAMHILKLEYSSIPSIALLIDNARLKS